MITLFGSRGHEIFHYGVGAIDNDLRQYCEHIEVMSEVERQSFFGEHDRHKLYDIVWSGDQPYWQLYNQRAIVELKKRTRKKDFILAPMGGDCYQQIRNAYPDCTDGVPQDVMMVESGIGYYGTFSRYRVFESQWHRAWLLGREDCKGENNDVTVCHNFFDLRDFEIDAATYGRMKALIDQPYLLFIGRCIPDKGLQIALEVAQEFKDQRLIVAGQGSLNLDSDYPHLVKFGNATIRERAVLMTYATAVLCPTRFQEPFGGTAVEAQLCGTPAITTDHGAFTETVEKQWRCASQLEFIRAVERAQKLTLEGHLRIRRRAQRLFSLDAVARDYERYFKRLHNMWKRGWYQGSAIEDA